MIVESTVVAWTEIKAQEAYLWGRYPSFHPHGGGFAALWKRRQNDRLHWWPGVSDSGRGWRSAWLNPEALLDKLRGCM